MHGEFDPRFTAVADAFAANFADGLEIGAACAVIVDGQLVVDVWGGERWQRDTLVETRSAVKGVTAACLHLLVDRGLVDLDASVRRYWPELRADPLVRQVLTHEAGVPVFDVEGLASHALVDWDAIAGAIAGQEPEWSPGEQHGYHGVTFGWIIGEIVRRVTGKSIGAFLRDEICGPIGAEYYIGTPASEHHRIAPLVAAPVTAPPAEPGPAFELSPLAQRMYAPMYPPVCPPWNSPAFWSAEIPVSNGIGTARGLAAIYATLGDRLDLGVEMVSGIDAVLGIPVRRSLGFELPPEGCTDGRPPNAFGHPGASGFLAFADPNARLAFAYVKDAAWGGAPGGDVRAPRLIRALYDSL